MDQQEMQHILVRIAKKNNTTPENVYHEIQTAIRSAQSNANPSIRKKWESIPKSGDTPTVEEFIDYMVSALHSLGY